MKNRVVVTGLGVVAPNGVGLANFTQALKDGKSGITFHQKLKDLNFSCQIGGVPIISEDKKRAYLTDLELRNFNSNGILYGIIAGMDALNDAKFSTAPKDAEALWDTGIIFGAGTTSVEKFREAIYKIDEGNTRRLGSTTILQTMASGVSAYLSGIIGAGNMVTTNSSACATGTEAILLGYERIANGQAKQMLCGSCSDDGPYVWAAFDAIKVMPYKYNENPTQGSRPLSETANGFVPGSGAGALILESLESAEKRGAKIYCEILGGSLNCGGQREDGSMTAPNNTAVQKCITSAIENAGITSKDIDYINGHLTATIKDAVEIDNWSKALNRKGSDFPYINSTKGMVGHCLAASGSIEAVASILQMQNGFIAPNINCDDLNPEITKLIAAEKIVQQKKDICIKTLAKASFGFGDVNACIIFQKK